MLDWIVWLVSYAPSPESAFEVDVISPAAHATLAQCWQPRAAHFADRSHDTLQTH